MMKTEREQNSLYSEMYPLGHGKQKHNCMQDKDRNACMLSWQWSKQIIQTFMQGRTLWHFNGVIHKKHLVIMRNSNTANNVKCYEDVDPLWHFNGITYKKHPVVMSNRNRIKCCEDDLDALGHFNDITYKKYSSTMWNGNSIKCCEDDLDKASWLNVG